MRRIPLPLLLFLCLCLSACGGQARTVSRPVPIQLPSPTAAPADLQPGVPVYVDGLLRLRGYLIGGELYLCPEDVCRLFDIQAEAAADERGYTLTLPVWRLEAPADTVVYTVDGRCLYCPTGYQTADGRVCLPADAVGRLFGLQIRFDGQRADIDTSRFQLLKGGEDYYNSHFHADDLFWLSHIIYAEAHWETLDGQIGVGNVVLNRVKSDLFPETVMAVVLDQEHRVQFDPVETGEVLAQPDEQAVLAACLCLEGYNTVGDSLYFVNAESGDATWFENALVPTVTIGHHQFYS